MPEDTQLDKDETPTPPNPFTSSSSEKTEDKPEDDPANDPTKNPIQGLDKLVPDVRLETAAEPFRPNAVVGESKSGRYIQYNSIATVRIMDEAAWKAAHVDSDRYFEWNYLNHKRIPIEAFTDDELRYLLRVDGRFSIVEVKPKDDENSSETTE